MKNLIPVIVQKELLRPATSSLAFIPHKPNKEVFEVPDYWGSIPAERLLNLLAAELNKLYDYIIIEIVKQVLGENSFEKHSLEELSKMFEVYQFTSEGALNMPMQVFYNRNLIGYIAKKFNENFSVKVTFTPQENAF